MATQVCWSCASLTHMTRVTSVIYAESPDGESLLQAAFQCDQCKRLSVGVVSAEGSHGQHQAWLEDSGFTEFLPARSAGKDFPDVIDPIAAAADEAHRCLSAGAPRGAVALARAVVEATAKNQGVTTGSLMNKIDALAKQGVISNHMRDAAHEIRFAGNEVAHGDLAEEPMSSDDARDVLDLMDAILERVYQEPAKVARVRERREARKATGE